MPLLGDGGDRVEAEELLEGGDGPQDGHIGVLGPDDLQPDGHAVGGEAHAARCRPGCG